MGERAADPLQAALGASLRSARLRRGLSLQQAAAATGVDFRQIQQLESGRANPTVRTLRRVVAGYDRALSEVFAAAESAQRDGERRYDESGAMPPARLTVAEAAMVGSTVDGDVVQRFAANVRGLREALRWTVRSLADRAGVSSYYVRRVEAAAQVPTLRVADKFATAFGVELVALLAPSVPRSYAGRPAPLSK